MGYTMNVDDLVAERNRYHELYLREQADRQMLHDLYRQALLTIEIQKELLKRYEDWYGQVA